MPEVPQCRKNNVAANSTKCSYNYTCPVNLTCWLASRKTWYYSRNNPFRTNLWGLFHLVGRVMYFLAQQANKIESRKSLLVLLL